MMIGKLIFASQAVEYGLLYTRSLERAKLLALSQSHGNYKAQMKIPKSIISDLEWWLENLDNGKSIKTHAFSTIIYTDASDSGWGATDGVRETAGVWARSEKNWHINYKELMAVKLALEALAVNYSNCEILLRVDNTSAISFVNRMGSVRYSHYNDLAKEIWHWAQCRKIFLVASYIRSSENVDADRLSRIKNNDTEWELSDKYFEVVVNRFGRPEYDIFAKEGNSKCLKFFSWMPDPSAT